ncbi:patatin-like phospholipase family protein [Bacillus sp. EB106-08-02-XG196]|uniref:CBASS cGAMP-activated phospholipase n=1 Tax=Bacillus sp. EB106-08-02-XG196 TaxID=2737049 RepID=UPI0015C42658|nr:CBASS cGAMP-activated phospholipase [Bacillus sp. EB106-08-02-XG196]NWQ40359.1 patatin-like phospholipase family protein [Bacillus sp. EB106-08-02-XG196]
MFRNEENFKILSIDGGGIKGLYSAVILADFEEKYGKLSKHFDLICGTSTGGIIALALAAGIPAKQIVNFYEEYGPKIFPYKAKSFRLWGKIKQTVFSSKYPENNLREALTNVFGNKTLAECETNVLIPVSNITTGLPRIIKNDHSPNLTLDNGHKMVDVAMATTAAPTYFPIQSILTMSNPEHQFVDGGLYANNPSLHGIQEAYRYFINKPNTNYMKYSLLSIPTLHENFSYKRKLKIHKRPVILWGTKLLPLMMDLLSVSTDFHIKYLNETLKGHYVRIETPELTKKENKLIALDNSSKKSLEILIDKGHQSGLKYIDSSEIQVFFNKEQHGELEYINGSEIQAFL